MNILFVCSGNTCRSAMAAAIMNKIAMDNDMDIFIQSAGLFAETGAPASDNAVTALKRYGIDLSNHRAKQVTEELLRQCDLVLTMTAAHKSVLAPVLGDKVFTLAEYSGASGDVADPYGSDLEEYEAAAAKLYDLLVDAAEKMADSEAT